MGVDKKERFIGYEIIVRVYFPADEVGIVDFMEGIREEGACEINEVKVLNSKKEAEDFIKF
jgi:hypothetical protein